MPALRVRRLLWDLRTPEPWQSTYLHCGPTCVWEAPSTEPPLEASSNTPLVVPNRWFFEDCREPMRSQIKNAWATPRSRNQARAWLRSTFKTHVRWHYGHFNIAKAFMKYPDPDLGQLLQAWHQYKESSEYDDRVRASAPKMQCGAETPAQDGPRGAETAAQDGPDGAETPAQDDPHGAEMPAKRVKDAVDIARALRAQYRDAVRYHRRGQGRPAEETMRMYHSGELRRRANQATRTAGYGAIRDERDNIIEILKPAAFEDIL